MRVAGSSRVSSQRQRPYSSARKSYLEIEGSFITRTSGTYDPVRTILGDSGFSSMRYKYNHIRLRITLNLLVHGSF